MPELKKLTVSEYGELDAGRLLLQQGQGITGMVISQHWELWYLLLPAAALQADYVERH